MSGLTFDNAENVMQLNGLLNYKGLQALIAVVDSRSFRRAAVKLQISQAAVSFRIRRIESELGFPLVERKYPVRPTAQGSILADYARRMIAMSEETAAALTSV